jgi:diacylglycerol O-acyltransferase
MTTTEGMPPTAGTRIASADLTWLNMDRPNNLMVVNGLMWFDTVPDWDAVRAVVQERLVDRYEVLHQRPVRAGREWLWEDDPDFDLDRHVRRVELPEPGDAAALHDHVAARMSQPINRAHPLWELDLIDGYVGPDGQVGAAAMARFHHALADGIRIVQLILGLCDPSEGAVPAAKVGRTRASSASPIAVAAATARRVGGEVGGLAGGLAGAAVNLVPRTLSAARSLDHEFLLDGARLLTRPTKLTDAVTGVASTGNVTANTLRSAARLAMAGRGSDVVAEQAPDVAKRVSWIEGVDLATVKAIGRARGATVNDVLLTAVSMGLSAYLAEHGRATFDQASFLLPVALKPVDASLPDSLGNHFAMVMFPMPLGVPKVDELLGEVHARTTRLKNSGEAMLIYGAQKAVAKSPTSVGVAITELVANKTLGVLTNVPGPQVPLALAGTTVAGMLGWVPTAADQSLGICILSYAGAVNIGVSSDAGIMPDPDRFAALIRAAIDELAAA